jgi:hypothetical protein
MFSGLPRAAEGLSRKGGKNARHKAKCHSVDAPKLQLELQETPMPPPQDSAPTVPPLTFDERMKAAKYLTENYRGVQQAYLWLSVIAVGLVLAIAAWMAFILKDWKTVLPMFGASGVLSWSLGRLLYTWNTISRILVEGKL